MAGFKLTVLETQFVIHFDNFVEHFFQIFVKFTNQSLIVKLSFIFKQRKDCGSEKPNHIGFGKKTNKLYLLYNSHICKGTHSVSSSVSASSVTTSDL